MVLWIKFTPDEIKPTQLRKFKRTTDKSHPPDPFINLPCCQNRTSALYNYKTMGSKKVYGDEFRDV